MATSERSLKILHVLDHSLPLHSGYAFRSDNILRCQLKRGWQPVALTSPKHEASWKKPTDTKETVNGIDYHRTGALNGGGFQAFEELRLMKVLLRRICELVGILKPDIIHAHSPVLNVLPSLRAGARFGIPVVYEVRAFWEDAAIDHGTYARKSMKYRLVRFLETRACKKASHVAVLCEGVRGDLAARGVPADKLTPIPNAVNIEDFKACAPDHELEKAWRLENKKVIGFIGSFYRYEGLDLLLEAFSRLHRGRSDLMLILVGGGLMEEALKEMAARLGIADKVVFAGRLPHDRVPRVYALLDVLVYPRHSMRLTDLVTPLKPLEAMAMGKAVVASDVGGHKELIRDGETGLLFEAGNCEALATTLGKLLDSKDLLSQLGERGKDWVLRERSWEKTTEGYLDIYTKALDAMGKSG